MENLKDSELRYRRLFEAAQDGILILDAKTGMIEDVNPYLIKMLGYSREEFIKKKLWEVGAFKDIEASKDAFEALQDREYIRYEDLPLKTKDGRLIQVEFISNVYMAGDEKVIQCNIRENAEHKRIIAALQANEKKYQDLINQSPDGYFIIELTGHILTVNKAMCKELEFNEEEFLAMSIWDIIPDQFLEQYRERLTKILLGESLKEAAEYEVHGKNGKIHYVEILSAPRYSGENIIGFQGIARDITARKAAEDALRNREDMLERIFDILPVGLWFTDEVGKLLRGNPAGVKIWGAEPKVSPSEYGVFRARRIPSGEAVAPDDWALVHTIRDKVTIIDELLEIDAFDGKKKTILNYTAPVLNAQGDVQGAIVVNQDITERTRAETEIHHRLSELEVLYQSGLAFSQLLTPKAIAEKIIDLLDQKMDWHHTAIRLYHPETKTLELLAFNLPNPNNQEEHSATKNRFKTMQRFDQGLSGWVVKHGNAVRSNDLKNDLRYFETFPGLQSGLYVPIKTAERTIGVISIESEQPQAFNESDERLAATLATQAAIAIDNAQLFERLKHSNKDLTSAYDATIEGWSRALDLRDKETEGHTQRVTAMAMELAHAFGLSESELIQVRWGALLHDIGKMGVPDGILLKSGPLTDEEWTKMKMHPTFAYEMLAPIRYLRQALDIPYYHHEKWDGTGYPQGLKSAQIPLVARIFSVVDVWDALCSDRPYRPAWTREDVREHIRASSGTHFDPQVVSVFMQMPD